MLFEQLFNPESSTYTYLVADEDTREAALVNPVREQVERDLQRLRAHGLRLLYTLETHIHADHVTAGALLAEAAGSIPVVHRSSPVTCDVMRVGDGDKIRVGSTEIEVLETPGHTPDSVSFKLGARVLTGDALLIGGCGRTDFQGGDAGTLYDSVHRRLFALPGETEVYPAHDYQGHRVSTIEAERASNARFAHRTREEFVALMANLDLPPPRHIDEALPANIACGKRQTQEH